MIYYQGMKNKNYFEGWYFKQSSDSAGLALIVGISADETGRTCAFLQVNTPDGSKRLDFPFDLFYAERDRLHIKLGRNEFTEKGMKLNVREPDFELWGELEFGALCPVANDVMGPFRHFPMQCNHGVISMSHPVSGRLVYNGGILDFDGAKGYIEKDWGSSFPDSYLWVQANRFSVPCSMFASVAKVPFLFSKFRGFLCFLQLNGREYRFTTYNGAKIREFSKDRLSFSRGNSRLDISMQPGKSSPLAAPRRGNMNVTIHESIDSAIRVTFTQQQTVLFDGISLQSGYEVFRGTAE